MGEGCQLGRRKEDDASRKERRNGPLVLWIQQVSDLLVVNLGREDGQLVYAQRR